MTEEQAKELVDLFSSKAKPGDTLMDMPGFIYETPTVGKKLFSKEDKSLGSIWYAQLFHSEERLINLWIGPDQHITETYETAKYLINTLC